MHAFIFTNKRWSTVLQVFSMCCVLGFSGKGFCWEKCAVAHCNCPGIVDTCDSSPDLSAPSIQGELPLAGMQLGAGCGFLFHCSHNSPQSACSAAAMRVSTNSVLGNITKCDLTLTGASSGQRGGRTVSTVSGARGSDCSALRKLVWEGRTPTQQLLSS